MANHPNMTNPTTLSLNQREYPYEISEKAQNSLIIQI
jgi:hypothetical protein